MSQLIAVNRSFIAWTSKTQNSSFVHAKVGVKFPNWLTAPAPATIFENGLKHEKAMVKRVMKNTTEKAQSAVDYSGRQIEGEQRDYKFSFVIVKKNLFQNFFFHLWNTYQKSWIQFWFLIDSTVSLLLETLY